MWLTGHHAIPEVTLHIPREAEDFSRGDNQSKHMPQPTYLDWLQPIQYNFGFGFIPANIGKAFTCGENFNKKYRVQATLIMNFLNAFLS